jgi:Na+-transporting methylmalonyl-CoA/oxaloacetate decarboxylase gamma subunit
VKVLEYLVIGIVMLFFSILAFGPYLLGMMDHDDPHQKERRHED